MLNFKMSVGQLLKTKRDGGELAEDEIQYLTSSMVNGNITESQIGALLMAMYTRGLSDRETVHLTSSIITSGDQLKWCSEWKSLLVDKHSTGGVGDKISLILAPVLAACGLKVPMVSGRSLEHTGGTLDKLESIPGFAVNIDQTVMTKALEYAGCFIAAATSQLCPADKIMYQIRDITSTVDYINLIVPSIISKKVAGGSQFVVIDVKVGKAAFCKTEEMARALAKQLISVSNQLGVSTRAILSSMDEPLGNAVGNALEVIETIQCLSGNMPEAIAQLVHVLGSNLLEMTNFSRDGEKLIDMVIQDGSAKERFHRMLLAQGVNKDVAHRLLLGEPILPISKFTTELKALESGWVSSIDAWIVGQVCQEIGATRKTGKDDIDHSVGVVLSKHVGDTVVKEEVWITVHHSSTLSPEVKTYLQQALIVVPSKVYKPEVIIEVIQ